MRIGTAHASAFYTSCEERSVSDGRAESVVERCRLSEECRRIWKVLMLLSKVCQQLLYNITHAFMVFILALSGPLLILFANLTPGR